MIIQWDDSLETGFLPVDNQHRELIRRAMELESMIEAGNASDAEVSGMIDFLESYVVEHFEDEEAIMRKVDYPGYEKQRQAHQKFLINFNEIKMRFMTEGASDVVKAKLQSQVNFWLINHINTLDKELGQYMQHRAVPPQS